jgi:hypothetical protein
MYEELSIVKESMKEVRIDLMTERVMSERVMSMGVQESMTREVQASPSTAHGSGPSRVVTEKRTKHKDDLVNVNLILTILPDYNPHLADTVSHDSVLIYFDYTMVTVYLPNGIRAVRV